MTLSVDLFFSFRSPYSYLALTRTRKMVADYDVTVNLRPVYPLAVRVPGFFKKTNPQFAKYVVLDSMRVAKHENIPFRFPRPDPIVQDMTTLDVAVDQPHIHRLTQLGDREIDQDQHRRDEGELDRRHAAPIAREAFQSAAEHVADVE